VERELSNLIAPGQVNESRHDSAALPTPTVGSDGELAVVAGPNETEARFHGPLMTFAGPVSLSSTSPARRSVGSSCCLLGEASS
jgi:hypothetical protein